MVLFYSDNSITLEFLYCTRTLSNYTQYTKSLLLNSSFFYSTNKHLNKYWKIGKRRKVPTPFKQMWGLYDVNETGDVIFGVLIVKPKDHDCNYVATVHDLSRVNVKY